MIHEYVGLGAIWAAFGIVTLWLLHRATEELETWRALRRGEDALLGIPARPVVRPDDTLLEEIAYDDATMGIGLKVYLCVIGPIGTIIASSILPDIRVCIADTRKRVLAIQ